MKGIFVNIGGLFDDKIDLLNGKTPLETAYTPNLDFLLTRGESGIMFPTEPRVAQFSEESILNFFGNDSNALSLGVLDAIGAGINLERNEIAFRVNFGTIDSLVAGNVVDRRANRTISDKEARALIKEINGLNFSYDFKLFHVSGYRAILVLKANGFPKIKGNDVLDYDKRSLGFDKILKFSPKDREDESKALALALDEFVLASYEVMNSHSVNMLRKRKGLLPVNYLFVRGGGFRDKKLKKFPNWCSISCDKSRVGFSLLSGMKTFSLELPEFSGFDSYKNYWKRLRKFEKFAKKIIKKNMNSCDYFFVDFEDLSVPSFDNKVFEKKSMIEFLDRNFFRFLGIVAPMNNCKVLITSSSFVSSKNKSIVAEPVSVLLYNGQLPREKKVFNEELSRRGSLGKILGRDLFRRVKF